MGRGGAWGRADPVGGASGVDDLATRLEARPAVSRRAAEAAPPPSLSAVAAAASTLVPSSTGSSSPPSAMNSTLSFSFPSAL